MKNTIKNIPIIVFPLLSVSVFGQILLEEKFINQGNFIVTEGSVLSTHYPFENSISGNFENSGSIYYYSDFKNSNLYYPSKNSKLSKVYFMPDRKDQAQIISGSKLSEFQDVEFNDNTGGQGFELSNEITVQGKSSFVSGVVNVVGDQGMFTFLPESSWISTSDASHVQGYVEKQGSESFVYPIGDKGYYRPAGISAPLKQKELYVSRYHLSDSNFFVDKPVKTGIIDLLNTKEYWELKRSDLNTGDILLTLSWDERTTPKTLLSNPEKELHIVRWDAKQQLWVDEGGVVDLDKQEVTTATSVKGYGFFTLATVHTDLILEGDLVIYNLVSPNGDGKNDYFMIDNISRFPNNTVEIYNRWGVKVFDTHNYDSSNNVFRGYSDGRVTLNKNEKLPTGTYFYIVTYEYTDKSGSRMIKKSGYLHLEMD
jgi:gliding motility-associated-like protein